MPDDRPRYVIAGCAASGTLWIARVMTALGSACGHQRAYGQHAPIYDREGESSWLAAPYIEQLNVPNMLLVRDPLKVVRSISQMMFLSDATYWSSRILRDQMPAVYEAEDHLGRIIRYVALWDDIDADMTLLVDRDPPSRVAQVFQLLTDRPPRRDVEATLHRLGRNINTHQGPKSTITWADIHAHPDGHLLAAKARRFGYDTA